MTDEKTKNRKKRANRYYYEHRDEILARLREKRIANGVNVRPVTAEEIAEREEKRKEAKLRYALELRKKQLEARKKRLEEQAAKMAQMLEEIANL